ncbi:MAG: hypothetical protein HY868_10330 [Chloroflexi bacterium]|nr:hypothetical protein [Chloroflexota bacterium]
MRFPISVFAFFVLFAMLAACSAPTATPVPPTAITTPVPPTETPVLTPTTTPPPSRKGGTLRSAVTSDAVGFHPYLTTDPVSAEYQSRVFASGLFRRDPQSLQFVPNMANTWTVSDDGKTFTFDLRRDMKWSDGKPITAHDFAWTFEQANRPQNNYPYRASFESIASFVAKDDYTLVTTLKQTACVGLELADPVTPLPKHIWEKYSWSDPAKNPEILKPSVVSGRFTVKQWQRDTQIEFTRNDAFWRGASNLDGEIVRVVPDPTTQLQLLKSGELDVVPLQISDVAEAKKSDTLKLYQWNSAAAAWNFVGVNLRRAFLQDVAMRRALAYAMPRQDIADKVFAGLQKPLASFIAPANPFYNPGVAPYEYNIARARDTLAQAGYRFDASGKLLGKDGKPAPRLKIMVNTDNRPREDTSLMLQAELKKIGVESDVTGLDFQLYLEYLKKPPFDYDLYLLGWRGTIDPHWSSQLWSEAAIPDVNTGGYINKQVEALYAKANAAPCDLDARKQTYHEIQKIVGDDAPYLFLTYTPGWLFLNKRVIPNEPTALGIDYLPEKWYIGVP